MKWPISFWRVARSEGMRIVNAEMELIKRHLTGDEQASRTLIETYQDWVYNLAWRILGDTDEADDAAQEVFLNVLDALPRFRGECAFSTWLYRIAANTCIARNRLRKRRSVAELSVDDLNGSRNCPADIRPSALECVAEQERNARLHAAIAELAEPYRLVIVLHYFQSLAYEEIAQVMNMPVGTVKVRIYRAKHLLQRKLRTWREGWVI